MKTGCSPIDFPVPARLCCTIRDINDSLRYYIIYQGIYYISSPQGITLYIKIYIIHQVPKVLHYMSNEDVRDNNSILISLPWVINHEF